MRLATGLALGSAIISSSAAAQEGRRLDFGLNARVEHHTNVTRTTKEQATLRGLSLADTIFLPTASVDLQLPIGRQEVFLNGVAGYAFYDKNTKLDREHIDLTGGVRGVVGPCAVTLGGGYARGVNQIEDPTLIANVENVQERKRVNVDAACQRGSALGLVASASKEWTNNDLPFLTISDSELTSMMLGVSYSRPTLGTFTVFANTDRTEYPRRLIDDGYDLYGLGLTYERQLGARIQGSVTVAYNRVELRNMLPENSDEVETTSYAANLSYRASNRLRLEGSFDRSVTPASGFGRTYDLTNSYLLSGVYDLGSRITISAGGGRVERDSRGAFAGPFIQLTNSTTDTLYGSLTYKQSERLFFELGVGRDERSTNAPQFDYTNERVSLSVSSRF